MEQIFIRCTEDGLSCEACWRHLLDCSCEEDAEDYEYYKYIVKEFTLKGRDAFE